MAFRKRNVDLSRTNASTVEPNPSINLPSTTVAARGTRPSVVDGRLTISTGTPSLDGLLAGHGGLALGNMLLIEENGNTDYSGALLKYYAAEGILQNHVVHVVGAGDSWGRSLPGVLERSQNHGRSQSNRGRGEEGGVQSNEKMKIAWRYEHSLPFGAGAAGRASPLPKSDSPTTSESEVYCHFFDLAKKLTVPGIADIKYHVIAFAPNQSPFANTILSISKMLASTTGQGSIHRIVIPALLSPAVYPLHACEPQHILKFVHQLRSLLRQFPERLTVLATLPLEVHSQSTGIVRWLEILSDGVLELTPFPHAGDNATILATSAAATAQEEKPQGMVKIHKLPIFHERCGGGGASKGLGDNLAFTVSRRKFAIGPFSLPPADGDTEAQQGGVDDATGKPTKDSIDF